MSLCVRARASVRASVCGEKGSEKACLCVRTRVRPCARVYMCIRVCVLYVHAIEYMLHTQPPTHELIHPTNPHSSTRTRTGGSRGRRGARLQLLPVVEHRGDVPAVQVAPDAHTRCRRSFLRVPRAVSYPRAAHGRDMCLVCRVSCACVCTHRERERDACMHACMLTSTARTHTDAHRRVHAC